MDTTSSKLDITPCFWEWVWQDDLQRSDLHCSILLISQGYGLGPAGWEGAVLSTAWEACGCKKLNTNQQCDLAANTISSFLDCINSTPRRLGDSASIRAHLHLPLHTSDIRTIELKGENSAESCQNTQGVEEFDLGQELRELGLFGLARGISRGNLVTAWQWLWGACRKDGARLSWWFGVRMRGNAPKVKLEVWAG